MISHSGPWITDRERTAIDGVMDSGLVAAGAKAEEFRAALSAFCGAEHIILTPSGAMGIANALAALDPPAGAQVVVPTYVCHSVRDAILEQGLVPVYCDIGTGWMMTAQSVALHVTGQTAAIILVSPYGLQIDAADFRPFGVPLIHDLCQCFDGARRQPDVDLGDMLVLSFHAIKMICAGNGGALVVLNEALINEAYQGILKWSGEAMPTPDINAAMGIVQLSRWPEMRHRRQEMAKLYMRNIHSDLTATLNAARGSQQFSTALFRFPLRRRDGNFESDKQWFAQHGVAVRRGVDELLHRVDKLDDANFPNAVRAFDETISLPFYPGLTDDEIAHVLQVQGDIWQ